MKILYHNVPYCAIPRLAKEGKIKVGTRVKACEDQKKYPCAYNDMKDVGEVLSFDKYSFTIKNRNGEPHCLYPQWNYFLDILEDEEVEPKKYGRSPFRAGITVNAPRPNIEKAERIVKEASAEPLSFSEPLTKEAVGRVIYSQHYGKETIDNLSIDGEWLKVNTGGWGKREHYRDAGWHFESSDEITIEEAEKLTGKKIKKI